MKTFCAFASIVALALLAATARADDRQHRHRHDHYTPGYHIDHHNHWIRDSHGHVIGRYHHDVVHPDSNYILPHWGDAHDGTYYQHEGVYYYHPHSHSEEAQNTQPVQIEFGGFTHIDDLAARLDRLANELCLDLHYNYSHNPGFEETYAEAYQVLEAAEYIHAAEHQQDRQAIAERVGGLDRLFHHVQDDVRNWSRDNHRQVGQLSLPSRLDLMETTIHHLMHDVGVQHTAEGGDHVPQGQGDPERAPPPGGARSRPGTPIPQ
jgi:hypothetical protein